MTCEISLLLILFFRKDLIPFENAKIAFVDEIFAIEKPGTQLNIYRLASDNAAASAQQPLSELFSHSFVEFINEIHCDSQL